MSFCVSYAIVHRPYLIILRPPQQLSSQLQVSHTNTTRGSSTSNMHVVAAGYKLVVLVDTVCETVPGEAAEQKVGAQSHKLCSQWQSGRSASQTASKGYERNLLMENKSRNTTVTYVNTETKGTSMESLGSSCKYSHQHMLHVRCEFLSAVIRHPNPTAVSLQSY